MEVLMPPLPASAAAVGTAPNAGSWLGEHPLSLLIRLPVR
jgi:hypothetical protein